MLSPLFDERIMHVVLLSPVHIILHVQQQHKKGITCMFFGLQGERADLIDIHVIIAAYTVTWK